jgi:hypothetical protein
VYLCRGRPLGRDTTGEDRTPQTWVRSSVRTLNCDRLTLNTLDVASVVKQIKKGAPPWANPRRVEHEPSKSIQPFDSHT